MFTIDKFLFIFELEIGAFAIGMLGFTTSFLLEVVIVFLLYQSECFGLFKLYACATIVAYYMIASFMLVKEIFCDRKPSMIKHFLVIDIVATCIMVSGNLRFYEFYPNWWPLFLADTLIRFYSNFCIFSLLVKYRRNCTATDKSSPSKSSAASTNEGVIKVFDNFCGFFSLEVSGYVYCGLNLVVSVVSLVLLLIFEELTEEKILIFVTVFVCNAVMLLALPLGMKMKKSSFLLPFLAFTLIEISIGIYLVVSSMIVIVHGEEYTDRMKRFIDKINVQEMTAIGVWIYIYLCILSLYDVIRLEEEEKKLLMAKESITYGSVTDTKGSSSL